MVRYNIVAGISGDISLDSNEWLIIDIGYARKRPTNAIWRSDETLRSIYFRQVTPLVIETARLNPDQPLHLVIEAPLSAAFDGGGEPTTAPAMNGRYPTQLSQILGYGVTTQELLPSC